MDILVVLDFSYAFSFCFNIITLKHNLLFCAKIYINKKNLHKGLYTL